MTLEQQWDDYLSYMHSDGCSGKAQEMKLVEGKFVLATADCDNYTASVGIEVFSSFAELLDSVAAYELGVSGYDLSAFESCGFMAAYVARHPEVLAAQS